MLLGAVFSLNSWSFVDAAPLLPRIQPVGCVGVLAACLVSSVLFVTCVAGSVKWKRSEKGGTVFRSVSEKFGPQVCLVPFVILSAAAEYALSESKICLRLQAAAAGVFVISLVLKRGCIFGLALDLFLETLLNDWCVVLLLAALQFAFKAAHMGLSLRPSLAFWVAGRPLVLQLL